MAKIQGSLGTVDDKVKANGIQKLSYWKKLLERSQIFQ